MEPPPTASAISGAPLRLPGTGQDTSAVIGYHNRRCTRPPSPLMRPSRSLTPLYDKRNSCLIRMIPAVLLRSCCLQAESGSVKNGRPAASISMAAAKGFGFSYQFHHSLLPFLRSMALRSARQSVCLSDRAAAAAHHLGLVPSPVNAAIPFSAQACTRISLYAASSYIVRNAGSHSAHRTRQNG